MTVIRLAGGGAVCAAVAAVAAACGGASAGARRPPAAHRSAPARVAGASPAAATSAPGAALRIPVERRGLAAGIAQAEAVIDAPTSTAAAREAAGRYQQLAVVILAGEPPRMRRATLRALRGRAASAMRSDLRAAAALAAVGGPPQRHLPRWRIVLPPAPPILLRDFRLAQARFHVPWEDLAAIEFVESRFGRVVGDSAAGAQGPMQFMPGTWAIYGRGNVHDQRAAILGAARFLAAVGAPADLSGALLHYNDSRSYVAAVEDYAAVMRADPRAYDGYWSWQVLDAGPHGDVLLPTGYPRVRPVPLRRLIGPR